MLKLLKLNYEPDGAAEPLIVINVVNAGAITAT